jgi:hypothetical protein
VLLAAEIQGALCFLLRAVTAWSAGTRKTPRSGGNISADVVLRAQGEDITAIEAALIGCAGMNGAKDIYIADAGARADIRALAAKKGCKYFPGCGEDICSVLGTARTELVVLLDADTVPQPDLLEKTAGYFSEKSTAVVQLPSEYYNLDSVQHSRVRRFFRHEELLFSNITQPGRDGINAVLWRGGALVVLPKVFRPTDLIDQATVRGGAIQLLSTATPKDPEAKLVEWSGISQGDQLTFHFDFPSQASLGLYVSVLRGPQTGSLRVLVNGTELGLVDLNFERETVARLLVGQIGLRPGTNTITFVAMPANKVSKMRVSLLEVTLDK